MHISGARSAVEILPGTVRLYPPNAVV